MKEICLPSPPIHVIVGVLVDSLALLPVFVVNLTHVGRFAQVLDRDHPIFEAGALSEISANEILYFRIGLAHTYK